MAIDGPVASGKTVAARALAKELRRLYLDTGAMYRVAAFLALEREVDLDNEPAVLGVWERHRIRVIPDDARSIGYRVEIDGTDVTDRLFEPHVSAAVSTVAALPGLRAAMVSEQRRIAQEGPVVMAGRDIGTVVLPQARHKFFLTASLDERAQRRALEFAARGIDVPLDAVRAQIAERDRLDSTRAASPLRAAPDAVVIDSTGLAPETVVARMRERVAER